MKLSNTTAEYGLIAKAFHWSIAFIILGLLPMGLFMSGMENSPLKFEVFALHKSFGLLVFFLGVARIVWRLASPQPAHLETHQRWERVLASAAHAWLYVCVIGMPLSGWLMSSAAQFPIPFFGIQMPSLIAKDEQLAGLFGEVHEILAFTLLFILGLHIAGALKHHVIDKDETLQRMAFYSKGFLLPVAVVLVAGTSFAASAFVLGQDFLKPAEEQQAQQNETAPADATTNEAVLLGEHEWRIDHTRSKLQFETIVYNTPVTGDFRDFSGKIVFNPYDLSTAFAAIRIGLKDVVTGDADRDSTLQGPVWFNTDEHAEARFEASKFEKSGGNQYVAAGVLSLNGVQKPLNLPFTLDIDGKAAHMQAKTSINRTDFGIGMGEWEDGQTVSTNVDIIIDLTANQ